MEPKREQITNEPERGPEESTLEKQELENISGGYGKPQYPTYALFDA